MRLISQYGRNGEGTGKGKQRADHQQLSPDVFSARDCYEKKTWLLISPPLYDFPKKKLP
jgi:hypothetical protein